MCTLTHVVSLFYPNVCQAQHEEKIDFKKKRAARKIKALLDAGRLEDGAIGHGFHGESDFESQTLVVFF